MNCRASGNRRGRSYRQPRVLAPPRVDPFQLGVRQAKAGSPKIGSVEWGEHGHPAADWALYAAGYDGAPR